MTATIVGVAAYSVPLEAELQSLLSVFTGRQLTTSQASRETGTKQHRNVQRLVRKGLLRIKEDSALPNFKGRYYERT